MAVSSTTAPTTINSIHTSSCVSPVRATAMILPSIMVRPVTVVAIISIMRLVFSALTLLKIMAP